MENEKKMQEISKLIGLSDQKIETLFIVAQNNGDMAVVIHGNPVDICKSLAESAIYSSESNSILSVLCESFVHARQNSSDSDGFTSTFSHETGEA